MVPVSLCSLSGGLPESERCPQINDEVWMVLERCWNVDPSRLFLFAGGVISYNSWLVPMKGPHPWQHSADDHDRAIRLLCVLLGSHDSILLSVIFCLDAFYSRLLPRPSSDSETGLSITIYDILVPKLLQLHRASVPVET